MDHILIFVYLVQKHILRHPQEKSRANENEFPQRGDPTDRKACSEKVRIQKIDSHNVHFVSNKEADESDRPFLVAIIVILCALIVLAAVILYHTFTLMKAK